MKEKIRIKSVKRTQNDYSLSFKLQIVGEVERGEISRTAAMHKYGIQGHSTILSWLRKYSTFDFSKPVHINMQETPEQRIKALETQLAKSEQDLTFERLAKTNDSEKFMLKIYEALIIRNTAFCSSITEISA